MWQARLGLAVTAVFGVLAIAVVAADSRTTPAPTRAQLALMPLAQSTFGPAAAALTPEGPVWLDNDSAAASDLTPMKGARLAAMGRITGYNVDFVDNRGQTRPGRLIDAGSAVNLFRTPEGAAAYLRMETSTVHRYEGRRIKQNGGILTGIAPFAITGQTGALGIRAYVKLGQLSAWLTLVLFRVGPVVANVALIRTDSRDLRADARRLAATLDRRVGDVLAGRIPKTAKPTLGSLGPLQGGPDLAAMAIRSTDFITPLRTASEAYRRNPADIAEYVRHFELVSVDGTLLPAVGADVELRPSTAAAAEYVARQRHLFSGSQGRATMRSTIGADVPGDIRSVWRFSALSPVPVRAGDESFAFEATLTARGRRFDSVVCVVRRRSVVETLTLLSGTGGRIANGPVTLRLARAAVAHIDSALRR